MPVGNYPTFDACVKDQMNKGKSKESAGAICATIEKNMKKSEFSNMIRVIFSEIQFGEMELTSENIYEAQFEILKTGKFFDNRYGVFEINSKLLKEIKENFDNNVLEVDVAVDMNHMNRTDNAFAWVSELTIKGNSLFMKLKDITEECMDMLLSKKFKYFSIEFGQFEKPTGDGNKTTVYENVLRGVAMTNRPVVKGMNDRPMFFSENINLFFNHKVMFEKLAEKLKSKEVVTKGEFELLQTAFQELPEGEKKAGKMLLDEVEEKVVEESDKEEEKEEQEEKSEEKSEKEEEKKELAEIVNLQQKKLAESEKKIEMLLAEQKKKIVNDRMNEIMLSEMTKKGFVPAVKAKVESLITNMSDKEFSEFKELIEAYAAPDLKTYGSSIASVGSIKDSFDIAIREYQEKNKGISYAQAVVAVRKINPEFKSVV